MFQFFRFVQYNISHRCKVSFQYIYLVLPSADKKQHRPYLYICKVIINITAWCLLPSLSLRFLAFLFLLFFRFFTFCILSFFFSVFSFTILSTEEPVVIFLLSFFTHPAIFIIQKSIQTPRIIHFFLLISSSPHHPSCYTTDKECCHICSHDSRANRCSGKYG